MAERLINESSKYSVESTECWPKYLECYIRMACKLELTNDMKIKIFHHLLRDHALELLRNNIKNKTTMFSGVVSKMNEQFSSKVKLEPIARKMESFLILKLRTESQDEKKG